jgi:putative flavoprotein involved in K+ transport
MSLPESVDVLIVGAGHVGLAMSSFLTEARREHLVVERRDGLGGAWQDRWEEFALVTRTGPRLFRDGHTTAQIRTGS